MFLSRNKNKVLNDKTLKKGTSGSIATSASRISTRQIPELESFIKKRDYAGALTLLEFQRKTGEDDTMTNILWIAYCAFHLGDHSRAMEAYQEIEKKYSSEKEVDKEVHLYIACCLYYMQMYNEAEREANKGPDIPLRNRLLFHIAHRTNQEAKLFMYIQKITDSHEDQLSLAAIHFLRGHFQEALDIYKKLLLDNRDDLALNVYVAMCYYKLDYYDVSLDILGVYLQAFPGSSVAYNLKACNHCKLFNGKAAEAEIKNLVDQGVNIADNDYIQHNMVVFSNGEGALKVLPNLVDIIPEARLNLAIYYLKNVGVQEAYDLIKDLDPSSPQDYIIKAVVNAVYGQQMRSREHIKMAQSFFQLVGASSSECDTIPGRQCMASCLFLLKNFDDVNIYLNSIKTYMYSDDAFNWNYGIALAETGKYEAAIDAFLAVQSAKMRSESCYVNWLCRCYIMTGSPKNAWDLYNKMETSADSFTLLQLIANDCYRMGHFLYAAKAFDVLERLDPEEEFWNGKRGACIGVFQMVVAGKLTRENLMEAIDMLKANDNIPQVEYEVKVMKKWARENGMKVE